MGSEAVAPTKPRAEPGTLGHAAARIGLCGSARARHLAGERLGLVIGGDPELALQGLGAALVLAQRLAAAPGARIGAHQGALTKLGERVERHQPAAGLDRGIGLAGGILRGGQPLQDVANQGKRAVALGRQPFLKGLPNRYRNRPGIRRGTARRRPAASGRSRDRDKCSKRSRSTTTS